MDSLSYTAVTLGLLGGVASSLSYLEWRGNLSQRRDFLDDNRFSVWRSGTAPDCFLKVLDLPLSGDRAVCVAETSTIAGLEAFLETIPPLDPSTIRVYIGDLPNSTALDTHLQNHGVDVGAFNRNWKRPHLSDSLASLLDSLPDLLMQGGTSAQSLRMQSLMLALPTTSQTALSALKRTAIIPHNISTALKFRAKSLDESRAVVLMSSVSSTSIPHGQDIQHLSVAWFSTRLNKLCQQISNAHLSLKPWQDSPSRVNSYVQLLLLHYLYFHVSQFGCLMSEISRNITQKQDQLLDPQKVTFTRPILSEITSDTLLWEQICGLSRSNVELLLSAMDILSETLDSAVQGKDAFGLSRTEMRLVCSAQGKLASHIKERSERIVREFELFRGIQDSTSTWLLTLLASVFIPMSLATGILSMQTRFADLRFLLYDFVGVIIIIGSLAILVFTALKTMLWLADQIAKRKARSRSIDQLIKSAWPALAVAAFLALLFWALMLSSFLVGMIHDVGLGLRILGFGSAAFSVVAAISGFTVGWTSILRYIW